MLNQRAAAARVLYQVIVRGASLTDSLSSCATDARDRGFLQALCFGVCRSFFRLDALSQLLLDMPLKEKDQDIGILILVGLFQLSSMRVPAHAAISETVSAVDDFQKSWAKGLVNAVLRRYQREQPTFDEAAEESDSAFYSHPDWMIGKIKKQWPDQWQEILSANNEHPPFSLRVNQRKISRADYIEKLALQELVVDRIPETQCGIILNPPIDVEALPGFRAGEISVQDGAAQLVCEQLNVEKGLRVLDACAAPGGKTAYLLEQCDIDLVALDNDKKRLESVKENLARLNLSAEMVCADMRDVSIWWDGKCFDRVLLDAPCSASGVIRRHPDIKLLRRPTDIAQLAVVQAELLRAAWHVLKSGGQLLYATCSIFKEENTKVLEAFLAEHPDAVEEKMLVCWGFECVIGRQILPGQHEMDGFYCALLRKT